MVQLDFFVDALRTRIVTDPSSGEREEFAALLSRDAAAIAGIGLERLAVALAGLFDGLTPEEFTAEAREFMARATHTSLGRPLRSVTYQPMLELLDELRCRDFTRVVGELCMCVGAVCKGHADVEPPQCMGMN